MKPIPAPNGYEGCVYYVNGARAWRPSYRKVGETWWTCAILFGHAHLPEDEVIRRASIMVAYSIAVATGDYATAEKLRNNMAKD